MATIPCVFVNGLYWTSSESMDDYIRAEMRALAAAGQKPVLRWLPSQLEEWVAQARNWWAPSRIVVGCAFERTALPENLVEEKHFSAGGYKYVFFARLVEWEEDVDDSAVIARAERANEEALFGGGFVVEA